MTTSFTTAANLLPPFNLSQWCELLAVCFSHRRPVPPAAQYFMDKCLNDETFNVTQIFVAIDNQNGEMVATCRLFQRSSFVGIGDVATRPDWRGHGLAKALLTFALQSREVGDDMPVLLHASEEMPRRIYKSLGFEFVPAKTFHVIQQHLFATTHVDTTTSITMREAILPHDADLLMERFAISNSPVTRSLPYWQKWVPARWARRGGKCVMMVDKKDHINNAKCTCYVYGYQTYDHTAIILDEVMVSYPSQFLFLCAFLIKAFNAKNVDVLVPTPIAISLDIESRGPLIQHCDMGWMMYGGKSWWSWFYDTDSF